jgi:4-hydroxybenzoate polyprenyltransferase
LVILYSTAIVLFGLAFWLAGLPIPLSVALLVLPSVHLAWQVVAFSYSDPGNCLRIFKSNSLFGWIMFLGLSVVTWLAAGNSFADIQL